MRRTLVFVVGLLLLAPPGALAGVPACFARPVAIDTSGADRILRTKSRDVLMGLEGTDRTKGMRDPDLICSHAGEKAGMSFTDLVGTATGQTVPTTRVARTGADPQRSDISADNRFVVFSSLAELVPGDTNDVPDVYMWRRRTGEIIRISLDANGDQFDHTSFHPGVSKNGRSVVFHSNGVVLWDRSLGTTRRLASGSEPAISANGDIVAFQSRGDEIMVWKRSSDAVTLVSLNDRGNRPNLRAAQEPFLSASGRFVGFDTSAPLARGDRNRTRDVYIFDRRKKEVKRVSVASSGRQGNGPSVNGSASWSGRYIIFESKATNLVANDRNNARSDVFVHDQRTGATRLVSRNNKDAQFGNATFDADIAWAGRIVTFSSTIRRPCLQDNLFRRNLVAGKTVLLRPSGGPPSDYRAAFWGAISADGRFVSFVSERVESCGGSASHIALSGPHP